MKGCQKWNYKIACTSVRIDILRTYFIDAKMNIKLMALSRSMNWHNSGKTHCT